MSEPEVFVTLLGAVMADEDISQNYFVNPDPQSASRRVRKPAGHSFTIVQCNGVYDTLQVTGVQERIGKGAEDH